MAVTTHKRRVCSTRRRSRPGAKSRLCRRRPRARHRPDRPGDPPLAPAGQQPPLLGCAVTAYCEPPDFGAVLHALEHVEEGDVLVIAAAGAREFAMIGEILCGHLRRRGGVGVVVDGAVRDVATLAGFSDFAVFARHITPLGPTASSAARSMCR